MTFLLSLPCLLRTSHWVRTTLTHLNPITSVNTLSPNKIPSVDSGRGRDTFHPVQKVTTKIQTLGDKLLSRANFPGTRTGDRELGGPQGSTARLTEPGSGQLGARVGLGRQDHPSPLEGALFHQGSQGDLTPFISDYLPCPIRSKEKFLLNYSTGSPNRELWFYWVENSRDQSSTLLRNLQFAGRTPERWELGREVGPQVGMELS